MNKVVYVKPGEGLVCTQTSVQRIHTKEGHSHELLVESLMCDMGRVNYACDSSLEPPPKHNPIEIKIT